MGFDDMWIGTEYVSNSLTLKNLLSTSHSGSRNTSHYPEGKRVSTSFLASRFEANAGSAWVIDATTRLELIS